MASCSIAVVLPYVHNTTAWFCRYDDEGNNVCYLDACPPVKKYQLINLPGPFLVPHLFGYRVLTQVECSNGRLLHLFVAPVFMFASQLKKPLSGFCRDVQIGVIVISRSEQRLKEVYCGDQFIAGA